MCKCFSVKYPHSKVHEPQLDENSRFCFAVYQQSFIQITSVSGEKKAFYMMYFTNYQSKSRQKLIDKTNLGKTQNYPERQSFPFITISNNDCTLCNVNGLKGNATNQQFLEIKIENFRNFLGLENPKYIRLQKTRPKSNTF